MRSPDLDNRGPRYVGEFAPHGKTRATDPYRLAMDTFGTHEIAAAKEVLDSGQLTMHGRVLGFERAFAEWVGVEHAIMVNSGSSANLLMIDAMLRSTSNRPTLEPGDEVLVPGLAWPTTVWPIAQLGLVPVFADIDPITLGIDLASAEAMIGPRTRAMFIIHPLGRALDLRAYRAFCDENGLELLEDCCESLGAYSDGRHVGTAGRAGSFSFYFSHHISTIEGGMVVTNDQALADDLRGLRAHGWIRDRSDHESWTEANPNLDERFLFATVGYNLRPTEIQGAIGLVQLERLDDMLLARESLARTVRSWLAVSAPWLRLIGGETLDSPPSPQRSGRRHSWMTLPLQVSDEAPIGRGDLVTHLESRGVETRPVIAGNLARHPAMAQIQSRRAALMPVSDAMLTGSLMIGCHPIRSESSLSTLERAIAGLATF